MGGDFEKTDTRAESRRSHRLITKRARHGKHQHHQHHQHRVRAWVKKKAPRAKKDEKEKKYERSDVTWGNIRASIRVK